LIDLFEHLSAESRYLRFNEVLDHPDPEYVRREAMHLASLDPERGKAWIVFADLPDQSNAPVAGFRFVRTSQPDVAEVSVAVRDDLQQQRIGSKLLLYVAREAKAAGINKLVASFHTNNRGVWGLLSRAPYYVTTDVHGSETETVVDLTRPQRHRKSAASVLQKASHPKKETKMLSPVVYSFETNDGLEVQVCQETPQDVPFMLDLFKHLGAESRLQRFGDTLESVDPVALEKEATRLATLDPAISKAWLAFADLPDHPNTPVAGGRYTRTKPTEGEIHVVVRDDMQRRGIGSRLVYFVLDQARADGIRKVVSRFAGTNEAVWQVVQYSPYHVTWNTLGRDVEVTFHLHARTSSQSALN
jgi:GNAT superfamily N-acetyltransferase